MTTFENQITDYPKGARIEAIREIPLSSPSQNYYADPLPQGTRGVVTAHTDDGRAWINFDGHGQEGFGHTFEQPEKYIRVVCTHRDDNCPANHEQPRPEQAAGESSVPSRLSLTNDYEGVLTEREHDDAPAAPERDEHDPRTVIVDLIGQRERLIQTLQAACSTLKSYQYGNVSPELAKEMIATIERVLTTIEQEGTQR